MDLNPGVERWRARVRYLRSHAYPRSSRLRAPLDDISSVLFPSDCRLCGTHLLRASRVPVCDACRDLLKPQTFSMCALCGESLGFESTSLDATPLCRVCRFSPPPFVTASAYGQYAGALQKMIYLFKFERVSALSHLLAAKLAEEIAHIPNLPPDALVVAVPLHRAKQTERGYNQSRLLADRAVQILQRRGFRFAAAHDLLQRVKTTESQFSLTPRQRRLNLRSAFAVADAARVGGREILLVDDIYTTGATARECARTLLGAGAKSVRVVTLARTQRDVAERWDGRISNQHSSKGRQANTNQNH